MSKLDSLVLELKSLIRAGRYPLQSRFPSEYELAEEFGVNKTTANKAVMLLINEGYLERAASLRGGTIVKAAQVFPEGMLAIICRLDISFWSDIVSGALSMAFQKNYIMMPVSPKIEELAFTLRKLEKSGFKGLLSFNHGILPTSLPVVYIDEHIFPAEQQHYQVLCNAYEGGGG